jgi:hypothetical protein
MHQLSLWVLLVLAGLFGAQSPTGPRPVEPSGTPAADNARKDGLGLGKTIWICRVEQPGEVPQDLVTLLPPKETFAKGIIPEAIVGVLKRPLNEGEAIRPENFIRNKLFNDLMHEFIARHGPELKGLQAEAQRQGEGWVYLIDGRTATPQGNVPPTDIIGAFEVKAGRLVAQSYKRNPRHVLLSLEGFFRLPPELHEQLLKELTARNSKIQKGADGAQGKE